MVCLSFSRCVTILSRAKRLNRSIGWAQGTTVQIPMQRGKFEGERYLHVKMAERARSNNLPQRNLSLRRCNCISVVARNYVESDKI